MARNPKLVLDIQANVKQIQQTLSGLDTKISSFGKKVEDGTGSASASFAQFGLAVSGVQQAFGILDGTIGRVFRNIVEHGAEFEFAMDKVRGVLGDLGTDESMTKLENQARELGSATMKSASDIAGLQFELSKLGFNADEINSSTEAILNMGIAFDSELNVVAEVAGTTIRAFGLEASEATMVADVMAKAFSTSALDIDKFTNSMVYVAPIAKEAGITLQETTAVLGLLANKGIAGSIAGTAVRSIFQQLADEGSDLAKEIGRPVVGFNNMIEAFEELSAQGQDLTSVLGFMDRRTAGVFAGMIKDTETLNLMKDSLNGSAGASEALSKIMADNLKGDMIAMESATEGFWITVHQQLDPALRGLTQTLTSFIKQIDAEEIKAYTAGLTLAGIATVGWAVMNGKLTKSFKGLKTAMATSGVGALIVGAGLLIGVIIDMMDVFESDTEAINRNSDALEKNKQKATDLASFKKEISEIDDIDKLRKLTAQRTLLVEQLSGEKKEWREAGSFLKQYNEQVVTSQGGLFSDEISHWEVTKENWKQAIKDQQKTIDLKKQQLSWLGDETKLVTITGDARDRATERVQEDLEKEQGLMQTLIAGQGEQIEYFWEKGDLQQESIKSTEKELALLDLEIEKAEKRNELSQDATKTTDERLKIIKKIAEVEQKQNDLVLTSYNTFLTKKARIDDDEFDKKIHRLDDEEKRLIDKLDKSTELNQAHINELTAIRANDKTLTDEQDKKHQADIETSTVIKTANARKIAEIESFYTDERAKIEVDRVESGVNADNAIVASRYAMGQKIISQETLDFESYIDFLDARIIMEKAYSDEWFALLAHREETFDSHITKLNDGKWTGFRESLAVMNEEANLNATSAERKKELQDKMTELTMERLGKLRGGAKEFLKGEVLDFITAQQIKMFGKLAEILATGGATLGTSLPISLPLYGAGIAMLEVAKNKVSAFAKGGVINSPTMALMGEAGSELVIPEKGFKDYVREQIVPYQTDLIAQHLTPYNINQNFNQTLNQERMESLTALNTDAVQQMKSELGTIKNALMLPQAMTISDGNTFASGSVKRGSL